MDYQLGSEQLGYHSEILEYLEQVQEEAQRQRQKSKVNISTFRLEKCAGPERQVHSQRHRPSSGEQYTKALLQRSSRRAFKLHKCNLLP